MAVRDLGFVRYCVHVTLIGSMRRHLFSSQGWTKTFGGRRIQFEIQGFVRLQKLGETSVSGVMSRCKYDGKFRQVVRVRTQGFIRFREDVTLSGLMNTTYEWRVTAYNGDGARQAVRLRSGSKFKVRLG